MIARTQEMVCYEAVVSVLQEAGVTTVFGLMGEDTARLATAVSSAEGMRYVGGRHETITVSMADGYARHSGHLGVALASRGPGLTNALTGIVNARKVGTPLLAIAGDTPGDPRGTARGTLVPKHIREQDLAEALEITAFRVDDPDTAVDVVVEAVRTALGGRTVLLNIAVDLMGARVTVQQDLAAAIRPAHIPRSVPVDEDSVHRVADTLSSAERPVIIAGRGVAEPFAAAAVRDLAERSGALLGTTLAAKDLFGDDPYGLGIIGGFSHPPTRRILSEADLVVAIGATLNDYTTGFGELWPRARTIQVDIDAAHLGRWRPVDDAIVADGGTFAAAVAPHLSGASTWRTADIAQALATGPDFEDVSEAGLIDPRTLVDLLAAELPASRALVVDPGGASGFSSKRLQVPHPRHFTYCADFGSIGLSHGIGLGAAVAGTTDATVLFIGDGALFMSLGDLETSMRNDIPLIVVVLDDGSYGAERHYLDIVGQPIHEAMFTRTDFARIAETLGIEAVRVTSAEDVRGLAPRLVNRTSPLVLDCKIVGTIREPWLDEIFS